MSESDVPPVGFVSALRDMERLEAVIPCVGFDDLLEWSLDRNLPQVDHLIVVTSFDDAKTVQVCKKFGATVVQTDLYNQQGKVFSKGAALNMGLSYCQYRGWRMVLDADILLPDNFRRILFNHTHLDTNCLYGADRMDVIGVHELLTLPEPQWGLREEVRVTKPLRSRVITRLHGYLPLGYFQLWHAMCHRDYPASAGGTGLDDVLFSQLWPRSHRHLLPSVIVYHLCASHPVMGENWDGMRRSHRID